MLSGAGALGPFHLGVTKALLEQDLLPDVISGSSAGSFVAAVIGTHDEATLRAAMHPANWPKHSASRLQERPHHRRSVSRSAVAICRPPSKRSCRT